MDNRAIDLNPIEQIATLLEELHSRKLLAPICLSTLDNGAPNSRFVDLKGIRDGRFLFGTDSRSVKVEEFSRDTRVSFAAWWELLQVQIRVQGTVTLSDDQTSDRIFAARSRSAQALATVSRQSEALKDAQTLRKSLDDLIKNGPTEISRPPSWKVYEILPHTIEILRFSEDRLHVRTCYTLETDRWKPTLLNP